MKPRSAGHPHVRPNSMEKREIHFHCPLCGREFSAKGVKNHVKRVHPGMKTTEFVALLIKAEETGHQVVEHRRVELKGIVPSQKTAFSTGALARTKYLSVVPGGAIGLGKKK